MQEERPMTFAQKMQSTVNWVQFACHTFSAPVEAWLRHGFGQNYFGVSALFSLLLIPLWGTFFPDSSLTPLFGFWWGYLAMMLVARIDMFRRWSRGEVEHTRYSGRSRLHRILPRASELAVKGSIEPVFVLILGIGVLTLSEPLGSYLIAAGISMMVSVRIAIMDDRRRLQELSDAAIEQRQLAHQFRAVFP